MARQWPAEREKEYYSVVQGIVCPIMTPLTEEGSVALAKLEMLVNHVISGGVDALLVGGTNGEFFCLSDKSWLDLVAQALSVLQKRKPSIVNVSHCSLQEAIRKARYAKEHGADYITSTPPYYFALNNDEVTSYYLRLADASSLPLFLYNIPQYTKTDVHAILPRLAKHPNIIGIKDSSGLYDRIVGISQRLNKPFVRLVGTDTLLEETVVSRLDGIVPGLANLVPDLYHGWWLALQRGDSAVAQTYKAKISALVALYEKVPSAVPYLPVVRFGLRAIGLDIGEPCSPLSPIPVPAQQLIEQTLSELNIKRVHVSS
jgi:dihydrodipicolinate synthase/N-acetylneuraminate lyase